MQVDPRRSADANEKGSSRGTWRCSMIHSPARTGHQTVGEQTIRPSPAGMPGAPSMTTSRRSPRPPQDVPRGAGPHRAADVSASLAPSSLTPLPGTMHRPHRRPAHEVAPAPSGHAPTSSGRRDAQPPASEPRGEGPIPDTTPERARPPAAPDRSPHRPRIYPGLRRRATPRPRGIRFIDLDS